MYHPTVNYSTVLYWMERGYALDLLHAWEDVAVISGYETRKKRCSLCGYEVELTSEQAWFNNGCKDRPWAICAPRRKAQYIKYLSWRLVGGLFAHKP